MLNVFSWREAIQHSTLAPTTRHVLLNLSIFMNELGHSCFPSVETQHKTTGLSKRVISEHIQKAVDAGFLLKRRHGFAGQKWAHNEYVAIFPPQFGAIRAEDYADEKGSDAESPPLAEGSDSNGKKVVTEGNTNSSDNSPKKKYIKKPRKLVSLTEWEAAVGSPFRIEQVAKWVKEKKLCPVLIAEMVEEFRDRMHAGDNRYASYPDAFKVYVRNGYLSKKMDQLLAVTSPHTGKSYKESAPDVGGAI